MIRIETVTAETAGVFAAMTYPRFRELLTPELSTELPTELSAAATGEKVDAFGAFMGNQPVGLILLRPERETKNAQPDMRILSIMVARAHRRQGIGRALLDQADQAANDAGVPNLVAYYSDRMRNPDAFEGFLTASGWTPPQLAEFRLAGHADWTERARPTWEPMLRRFARQGYSATPWDSLTSVDRNRADRLVPSDWRFDYRVFERHCDPRISIVLRQHGDVIGWVLGENHEENGYYHYTNGYVVPELQKKGWLVAGVYDVCCYQVAAYGPKSVAVYETYGENPGMIAIMRRRLQPFTIWTDSRFVRRRALTGR